MALVREKSEVRIGEFVNQYMEAQEIEEACCLALEERVTMLEGKLEISHTTNLLLAQLITSLQGHIADVEDTIMDESMLKEM
jgi:hypothetical protein